MGFRARKSFKLSKAGGIRLNVSKSGLGMSFGVKGARYSVHSSGRRTTMLGNPIFGMGYVSSKGGGQGRRPAPEPSAAMAPPVKPGLLAPKGEKAFYKAVVANDPQEMLRVAEEHPDYRVLAKTIAGALLTGKDDEAASRFLAEAFTSEVDPADHSFVRKYIPTSGFTVDIAPGVQARLLFSRDAVGLLLAEHYQDQGKIAEAIDVVEQVTPTSHAAVSLAELYTAVGRHKDVVELTEGVANEDDLTALLLVYRGIALRELGYNDASLEALKGALKSKSRDQAIRHLALSERARTYIAMNKKAMARKDLERILAEDSSYEGVQERIAELGQ